MSERVDMAKVRRRLAEGLYPGYRTEILELIDAAVVRVKERDREKFDGPALMLASERLYKATEPFIETSDE